MEPVELVDYGVVLNTAEVLHHTAGKERTLAVLVAYMDESGIHEDSAVCAIAGYVGTAEEWGRFEHRWRQALRAESISEFHMSEFESGKREFEGWSDGRKRQLLAKLIDIIKARDIHGFGSAVILRDYGELSPTERSWLTHGNPNAPYFLCFQHCVVESCHRADGLANSEQVAFVFERQDTFRAEALRLFDDLQGQSTWPNRHRVGSIAFSSASDFLPLQAADILAFECYKHLKNKLDAPERGTRWPISQLARHRLTTRYFDSRTLRLLLLNRGHE